MNNKIYILVYDDTCSFCTYLAHRLQNIDYDNIFLSPSSNGGDPIFGRYPKGFEKNVRLIVMYEPVSLYNNYKIYVGAEAAIELLSLKWPLVRTIYHIPVLKQLIDLGYFLIKKARKYLAYFF